ncbi:hypothetical protein [Caballeronia telluris]|jgi:hypothetical protein|uniref:Late embryogenesis abundant protein n=1 Tax=Caballeronia telluris TaxID=326475 RepID=A0A158H256_9BURK|nr:hypothetical protein [Caballeronia telluris]SAL38442.1 hypothetical protein AWB66_01977 [Caballeronia telluris]
MKQTNKLAVVGMLAFALSAPVFAQGAGGGSNSDGGKAEGPDSGMAASGPHVKHKKGTGGTTLHQENKAAHLKGASAAKAASALGTNDKGQPQ